MSGEEAKAVEQTAAHARPASHVFLSFVELTKPELTSLSVATVVAAFLIAHNGTWNLADVLLLLHATIGTLLVGGGSGALNEYMERGYDAQMKRTERRPLPSGRLEAGAALWFGSMAIVVGIAELTIFTNVLTGFLAGLTAATYLLLYTPLKRLTPLATLIGGIPGAIPPMMGWTAARNSVSTEAWVFFVILFLWQMPHFFSLAWLYRKDYGRAGYRTLTVLDINGRATSRQLLMYGIALLPASLLPSLIGIVHMPYFWGALALGAAFLVVTTRFAAESMYRPEPRTARMNDYARQLFYASLAYLPLLFGLMVLEKV